MNNIHIPTRGAIAAPLFAEVVRALTAEDIMLLATSEEKVQLAPTQKLRAVHHKMAMLLSEGKGVAEVGAITGYTPQRITQLQNDPAFQDLIKYYSDQLITAHMEDAVRLQSKLVDVAEMALNEISERLEDDATRKAMPVGELRQLTTMGADRTVAPPKATTTVVNVPHKITLNIGGRGIREAGEKTLDNPPQRPIIDAGE